MDSHNELQPSAQPESNISQAPLIPKIDPLQASVRIENNRPQAPIKVENILGVPTREQITGIYGEGLVADNIPYVDDQDHYRCLCCNKTFAAHSSKRDRRNHLLTHVDLAQSEEIRFFQRAQALDELSCLLCSRDFKFAHAKRHAVSCNNKKTEKTGKRIFQNRDQEEDMKLQEEKTVKKVKQEEMMPSFIGREQSSLKNQITDFIQVLNSQPQLSKRDLKMKIEVILKPFNERYQELTRLLQENLALIRQSREDIAVKNAKIKSLEDQIKQLDNEMKATITKLTNDMNKQDQEHKIEIIELGTRYDQETASLKDQISQIWRVMSQGGFPIMNINPV